MKILHINSYYNGSRFYMNLYEEQLKRGMDLRVFVPVNKSRTVMDFDFGPYTKVVPSYREYHRYFFRWKQRRIRTAFQRTCGTEQVDLIHAHSVFTNGFLAYELWKERKIPYIVAVRNTDVNFFFRRMKHLRKTGIRILLHAKQIIFLSESYLEEVLKQYVPDELRAEIREKCQVIPNGLDSFWFSHRHPGKKRSTGKIKVLFAGNMSRNKNAMSVVRAVHLLRNRGLAVEMHLVGKPKDPEYLEELRKQEGVFYHGFRNQNELLRIYADCDIFVLPSRKETFGLVYLEAMSQGLPVIYTRGQGFQGHFMEGVVGFAVDPDNIQEIADRIEMISEKYEVFSRRAAEGIERFQWSLIAEIYQRCYENVRDS